MRNRLREFLIATLRQSRSEMRIIMKNILLIGLGRFGRHIAIQLNQLGHDIMAIDTNEERVNDILPFVTNAQIGDSTNPDF